MLQVSIPTFEVVSGETVPERITASEFLRWHLQQFPRLNREENKSILDEAIESVYTMFSGVGTIWSNHQQPMWFEKTQLCYRLLIAWYVADMYPMQLSGVPTMGGIPLKAKKIGDVNITFADAAVAATDGKFRDRLGLLKSNPFGYKAYLMITSSIANNRVYPHQ